MRPGKFRPASALCLQNSRLRIRMTLGAKRNQFLQSMLFDGLRLRPALFGLSHGLLLKFAATRIFQSTLSGTRPLDHVVRLRRCWRSRFWPASLPHGALPG
jgi:hypothetical protein